FRGKILKDAIKSLFLEKNQMEKLSDEKYGLKYWPGKGGRSGCFWQKVRAPRKAPSICYYPMKTLFEYKGKGMLFFFEILEAK
ncbi:hypothetical protein, partial [Chitinophaga sp.]|uniref:hypothetical protein n=1 Tax=Chitinophaga sp. TaxID=1869181 RepID=UPI002C53F0A9